MKSDRDELKNSNTDISQINEENTMQNIDKNEDQIDRERVPYDIYKTTKANDTLFGKSASVETKKTTTESPDPKNTGTESADTKNTGTESADPKNIGTESADTKNIGTESTDTKNTSTEGTVTITECLTKTLANLTLINGVKEQLSLLPLDFNTRNYYNNCVFPLIATLDQLSRASGALAASVTILTNSPIVPVKKSEIKDSINLIYDINEQCEDVYKVVRKRIEDMLECTKC